MVTATMPLPLIFVLEYNVCLPHTHTDTYTCQNATCAQQVANTLMKWHHTVIFVFVTEHTKPTLSN